MDPIFHDSCNLRKHRNIFECCSGNFILIFCNKVFVLFTKSTKKSSYQIFKTKGGGGSTATRLKNCRNGIARHREAPFWKVVRIFGHCPNSFWPAPPPSPLCQTGTMLHFFQTFRRRPFAASRYCCHLPWYTVYQDLEMQWCTEKNTY